MDLGSEVSKSAVRDALEQVLQWKGFAKSPLLSRFLRFIVERTLDGHANQIKEYTVGISVLDKPHGFNPQTDASVRINAIRLRKLLQEYYQENEGETAIRILLPKGSYCPEFLTRNSIEEASLPLKTPVNQQFSEESICVVPFTGIVHNSKEAFSVEGFSAYLSEQLSLFQDIKVKSYGSVIACLQDGRKLEKLGPMLKVTYYLTGSIEIDAQNTLVSVQLFDAGSNTLIWSQDFSAQEEKDSLKQIIDRIASKIVGSLAGYSGLIHQRLFTFESEVVPVLSDTQANAVFWFYHFQTRLSEEVYQQALTQLERVTRENQECDLCWAVLAHLYVHGIIYQYQSGVDNPIARAQAYLARAFALNPHSQQAYITLAWIQIFLRNKAEAKRAIETADKINPNSSYAIAVSSLGMSFLGEYEAAEALMEKAIPLHPLPFWWFNLPPIFMALKANDYNKMLFYARKIGTPAGIHEHVFEMIALYYLGETNNLRKLLKTYLEKFPDGITHAMRAWPKILFDELLVEKLTYALMQMEEMKKSL